MEAPKKNVVFEEDSLESKRVINQTGVRARMPKLEDAYGANACWDGIVAPDGRLYYPLSSENGFCKHTKLAYFDYDKDEIVVCMDTDDVLLVCKKGNERDIRKFLNEAKMKLGENIG